MLCIDITKLVFAYICANETLFIKLYNYNEKLISNITIKFEKFMDILKILEYKIYVIPTIIYSQMIVIHDHFDKVLSFKDDNYIIFLLTNLDMTFVYRDKLMSHIVSKLSDNNYGIMYNHNIYHNILCDN